MRFHNYDQNQGRAPTVSGLICVADPRSTELCTPTGVQKKPETDLRVICI